MADRKTDKQEGKLLSLGVAVSTLIEAGKMVAKNAAGYMVEAADAANLVVMGAADERADNSSGANGAINVKIRRRGIFKFKNSATNAATVANIGGNLYVEDDETVSTSGGTNNIVAGKCVKIDSDGVWIEIG